VISTVRVHRVQAKMNLRYFLESTANAAFSLANSDTRNYFDLQNNRAGDAQKATTKAYKWLEATYSAHSNFMRKLKADINEQTAHAHVINSQHNFDFVPGQRAEIITSYFDFEDDELVKLDLWVAAKAGLHAIDLILTAQKDFGGFLPSSDTGDLPQLMTDNDAVLRELRNGKA
jgi:hypothetical protein